MSSGHSRNVSSDTTSSQTSAYQFILEHILAYPGTYGDVPLRSMYALNLQAMNRSLGSSATTTPIDGSPTTPSYQQPQDESRCLMRSLQSSLVNEYSKNTNRKEASLPPSFITSFLHSVFPMQLDRINFPQALTALDYLKDMETRRRREQAHAFKHLGVDQSVLDHVDDPEELSKWYPDVADFLQNLPKREKRADILYSQLYVALRRWILINEMMLPFNKANCHAMLNTLYPPATATAPTSRLTVNMLMQQRNGFFKYIKAVERQGVSCLSSIMMQGAKNGEPNGWPAVKRTLHNYLNLANSMIEDCQFISTLDAVSTTPEILPSEILMDEDHRRSGGKTDSGISFGSEGKHMKNPSTSSSKSTFSNASHASYMSISSAKSQGSTLERIARELKRLQLRPRRLQATELINSKVAIMPRTLDQVPESSVSTPVSARSDDGLMQKAFLPPTPVESTAPSPSGRTRFPALRKMRSLGALAELKHNNLSATSLRTGSDTPAFDPVAMRRHREAFESRRPYEVAQI